MQSTFLSSESGSGRTHVKICGLREIEHVDAAVQCGADAIGFVFFPPSPRFVTLAQAAALRARVPAQVSVVALFVNPTPDHVREVIEMVRPDVLQFHGEEPASFCTQFGVPYMKAVAVAAQCSLLDLHHRYPNSAAFLFDAPSAGYGGSGQTFDWSLLTHTLDSKGANAPRVVLSGGLNAANVRDAIARVRPDAVDVSSGVERAKGVKSTAKIQEFIAAVRSADQVVHVPAT